MKSAQTITLLFLAGLLLQGCASSMEPRSSYTPPPGASPTENSSLDTGQLEPTVGHRGDQLGAEVISADDSGELHSVEINVPIQPDLVDQVQVLTSEGEPMPLSREAQIVHNYETNNVGISVQVPKSESMGFRLKLIDHRDDEWPPVRQQ
jgi:hypothetical protein